MTKRTRQALKTLDSGESWLAVRRGERRGRANATLSRMEREFGNMTLPDSPGFFSRRGCRFSNDALINPERRGASWVVTSTDGCDFHLADHELLQWRKGLAGTAH